MLISNILKYFVNQYFLDQIKYILEADKAYTVWDSVLVSVSQGMVQGTPASMSFFFFNEDLKAYPKLLNQNLQN